MDSIDKLVVTCKQLYDVRVVEQRQEIERLKNEIKKEVFIVITEECYGGDSQIQIFHNRESAEIYKKEIEDRYNIDVMILTRQILKNYLSLY